MRFETYEHGDDRVLAGLWSIVYRNGSPIPEDEELLSQGDIGLVAFDGDRPVAGLSLIPYQIRLRQSVVPAFGVSGVAVLPEARNSGVGKALMMASLNLQRAKGAVLSVLYPFRETYYRRFGYETAGKRFKVTIPRDRMPHGSGGDLHARQLRIEDWQELDACYQAFVSKGSGGVVRSEANWKTRFGKVKPLIYAVGDPVEAYCWTHMTGGFWDGIDLGEFVWSTIRGHNSLMGFLRGLGINRGSVTLQVPEDSPLIMSGLDEGITVEQHRQAMFRILDVQRAIDAVQVGRYLKFQIIDPCIAENCGEFGEGSASVKLGIETFTQAMLGDPGLEMLVQNELVDADPNDVPDLRAALPRMTVMLTEFF